MNVRHMSDSPFTGAIEQVARELLGEPNPTLSTRKELRWGNRGSLSVDLEKDCWHDHEAAQGGGVFALVERQLGVDSRGAADWLRARGMVEPEQRTQPRREVARYRYRDEAGAYLFDVVRFQPKDFRQQAANGAWSIKGIRRVLYRLPELLAAPEASVLIVEGEKDADRLATLGFTATCNPGGAGKWHPDYTKALAGRRCIAIPDNDDAGRNHAQAVVQSLQAAGIAASVLALDGLPPKGDVSDWLDAGHGAEDLQKLIAALPAEPARKGFALVRASDMEDREPEFLIEDIAETSSLALGFGDPGCGKSFVLIGASCCIATGRDFHGKRVLQGLVIYLAGEGHNGIKRRLRAWEKHTGQSLKGAPLFFSKVPARLLDAAHAAQVAEAVDEIARVEGAPRLIVIDTLARSFAGGDENSTEDMGNFIAAIDALKARYPGCTALIVHHTGHSDKQRARGNFSLKGALDAEYRIEKDGDAVTLTCTKMKDAPEPPPMGFRLQRVDLGVTSDGKPYGSAVLVAGEAAAPVRPRTPQSLRAALASFLKAKKDGRHADDLGMGVHVEDWRAAFYETSTADTPHAKKVAFQRARRQLVESGDLSVHADIYRLARIPEGMK